MCYGLRELSKSKYLKKKMFYCCREKFLHLLYCDICLKRKIKKTLKLYEKKNI
jgi:hypothetical protein